MFKERDKKGKVRVVLLSDDVKDGEKVDELSEDLVHSVEELKKKIIRAVKNSIEETEEGYLFMTEVYLCKLFKIKKEKLKSAVDIALKEKMLKFDDIKGELVVVYTQDRRMDTTKHV